MDAQTTQYYFHKTFFLDLKTHEKKGVDSNSFNHQLSEDYVIIQPVKSKDILLYDRKTAQKAKTLTLPLENKYFSHFSDNHLIYKDDQKIYVYDLTGKEVFSQTDPTFKNTDNETKDFPTDAVVYKKKIFYTTHNHGLTLYDPATKQAKPLVNDDKEDFYAHQDQRGSYNSLYTIPSGVMYIKKLNVNYAVCKFDESGNQIFHTVL